MCQLSNYLLGEDKDYENVLPIETTGDGNCMFNAVSTLVYGNETFNVELRMRAVINLIFNFEFYLDEKNYGSSEMFNFALQTVGNESNGMMSTESPDILLSEILRVCRIREFTGIMLLFALANSLSIQIHQIYPKTPGLVVQSNIFKYCNSIVKPFTKTPSRKCLINFIKILKKKINDKL